MQACSILPTRADRALRESPIPSLRRLHIDETDDEVVISGSVASYYLKQLAQETVMPVLGERELVNRVRVSR